MRDPYQDPFVTPHNIGEFVRKEDYETARRIFLVLHLAGIKSTPCEEGVFEGDLGQWSLGPAGAEFHRDGVNGLPNYPEPAPLGFYADMVISNFREPETFPGFEFDLEKLVPIIRHLEIMGTYCYPSSLQLKYMISK